MQTEEHPQHSTKQQYHTEQKKFQKFELIMKTNKNNKFNININRNQSFVSCIKRTLPLTHIKSAYIYIYIHICLCVGGRG
jgi:hypothetical protein